MRRSIMLTQSKNILASPDYANTNDTLINSSRNAQDRLQAFFPKRGSMKQIDSLDEFLNPSSYIPNDRMTRSDNASKKLQTENAQLPTIRASGRERNSQETNASELVSPVKPIKRYHRQSASMATNMDIQNFFCIDEPPKEVERKHKRQASQPFSKCYQLVSFTDYVEKIYGIEWFQKEQQPQHNNQSIDDFFNNIDI